MAPCNKSLSEESVCMTNQPAEASRKSYNSNDVRNQHIGKHNGVNLTELFYVNFYYLSGPKDLNTLSTLQRKLIIS